MFEELNTDQQEAIFLYAREKGRNWKSLLQSDWMNSSYNWDYPNKNCHLQQIRNNFGPSWLKDLELPECFWVRKNLLTDEELGTIVKALRFWQNRNYLSKIVDGTAASSEFSRITAQAHDSWEGSKEDVNDLYDKKIDKLIDKIV